MGCEKSEEEQEEQDDPIIIEEDYICLPDIQIYISPRTASNELYSGDFYFNGNILKVEIPNYWFKRLFNHSWTL